MDDILTKIENNNLYCGTSKKYQSSSFTRHFSIIQRKWLKTNLETMFDLINFATRVNGQLRKYLPNKFNKVTCATTQRRINRFQVLYMQFKNNEPLDDSIETIILFYETLYYLRKLSNSAILKCSKSILAFYMCSDLKMIVQLVNYSDDCENIIGKKLVGMAYEVLMRTDDDKIYQASILYTQFVGYVKNVKNRTTSTKPTHTVTQSKLKKTEIITISPQKYETIITKPSHEPITIVSPQKFKENPHKTVRKKPQKRTSTMVVLSQKQVKGPPLISKKTSLENIAKEYKNENIIYNILQLKNDGLKWVVKIKGDGNCFYRAFVYLFLTYFFKHKNSQSLAKLVIGLNLEEKMSKYDKITWHNMDDIYRILYQFDFLENKAQLLLYVNNVIISDLVVMMFRQIVALELLENYNNYAQYQYDSSLDNYVLSRVLKMGEDAEEFDITALAKAINGAGILDSINDQNNLSPSLSINHIKENNSNNEYVYALCHEIKNRPIKKLRFMFRPGHYDVLL